MGGSGGGIPIDDDKLDELEDLARRTIRERIPPKKRNIFISFAYEDSNEVNLLRAQAKNENNELEFNDYSVKEAFDSQNAEYIRRRIRERIRQSSVTVVYISNDTVKSKWVDWEIRESARLGKGIVAVHKGDSPPQRLPLALKEMGISPTSWSPTTEFTKAIDKASKFRK